MTELKFYLSEDLSELDYILDDIQSQYTATAKQSLEKIEERNQRGDFFAYPITIFYQEKLQDFSFSILVKISLTLQKMQIRFC